MSLICYHIKIELLSVIVFTTELCFYFDSILKQFEFIETLFLTTHTHGLKGTILINKEKLTYHFFLTYGNSALTYGCPLLKGEKKYPAPPPPPIDKCNAFI